MRINIVSSDKRYTIINGLLLDQGYDSFICAYNEVGNCDYLVLPIRKELEDEELKYLLDRIDSKTVILCGDDKRIETNFGGHIVNYGKDEWLLGENARLTAEATISYLHRLTKSSLNGKKIFVSGYGRIGRGLCYLIKCFGASVFAYARRQEVCVQMIKDGVLPSDLGKCRECDIVINTVPFNIYSADLIKQIPDKTTIIELASAPYGFECMERVEIASGLPGKILETSGAYAIFKTIVSLISSEERGSI